MDFYLCNFLINEQCSSSPLGINKVFCFCNFKSEYDNNGREHDSAVRCVERFWKNSQHGCSNVQTEVISCPRATQGHALSAQIIIIILKHLQEAVVSLKFALVVEALWS